MKGQLRERPDGAAASEDSVQALLELRDAAEAGGHVDELLGLGPVEIAASRAQALVTEVYTAVTGALTVADEHVRACHAAGI
eukprot:COSAG05_NODE_3009_length_2418_cov_1.500216_1_plen_82_part_00